MTVLILDLLSGVYLISVVVSFVLVWFVMPEDSDYRVYVQTKLYNKYNFNEPSVGPVVVPLFNSAIVVFSCYYFLKKWGK